MNKINLCCIHLNDILFLYFSFLWEKILFIIVIKMLFLVLQPCRYGIACMHKASCQFTHPAVPGKDKLSWSSAAAQNK